MGGHVSRRQFLASASACALLPEGLAAAGELRCDVAIIGGGTGGCAAALAAARNGARVIMTEETDWLGGQLTSQAVPPDEHRWIEEFGLTGSYRDYRSAVRDYYRKHLPLTAEARSRPNLNPGDGTVSHITHEPQVSRAVLEKMLEPYVKKGRLIILTQRKPVGADVDRDRVKAVTVRAARGGRDQVITAPFFLDATEQGDLLPLARVEYVTGFESRSQTGEPHAPEQAQPANIQAFTWCFVIDHLPGEDHTIERPAEYGFWREYVPALTPPWPGKLLSWNTTHPITLQPRTHPFDPECDTRGTDGGLWTYRRIARKKNFARGYRSDICLVNWPQNDYWLGNLHEVSADEAARHLARARQLSLSLLYWMQTEAPRADGGQGWRGLRLRPDVTGTEDGLAKYPYIREVAQDPGGVHRPRTTRRDRRPRARHRSAGVRIDRGGLPGLGRGGELPYRSAPQQRGQQLHRRRFPAVPDPARLANPAPGGESARGGEESRRYPHHQRLLPAAPGGVEHRGVGGAAGGREPEAADRATAHPQRGKAARRLPGPHPGPGGPDRLARPARALAAYGAWIRVHPRPKEFMQLTTELSSRCTRSLTGNQI